MIIDGEIHAMKTVTATSIRRLRGILKRKPGDKPLAEALAKHKRGERRWRNPSTPAAPVLDNSVLLAL